MYYQMQKWTQKNHQLRTSVNRWIATLKEQWKKVQYEKHKTMAVVLTHTTKLYTQKVNDTYLWISSKCWVTIAVMIINNGSEGWRVSTRTSWHVVRATATVNKYEITVSVSMVCLQASLQGRYKPLKRIKYTTHLYSARTFKNSNLSFVIDGNTHSSHLFFCGQQACQRQTPVG